MATVHPWKRTSSKVKRRHLKSGRLEVRINHEEKLVCLSVARQNRRNQEEKILVVLNEDEIAFLRKGLRLAILPPEPPPVWIVRGSKTLKKGDYLANLDASTIMTPLQSEARRFASVSLAKEVSGTGRVVKLTPRATYLGEGLCSACVQQGVIREGMKKAMARYTPDSPFREQLEEGLLAIEKVFEGHVCSVPVAGSAAAAKAAPTTHSPPPPAAQAEPFEHLDPAFHDEWILNSVTRRETKAHPTLERRSIKVNTNDTVTVRLTPAGVDVLNTDRGRRFSTAQPTCGPGPYTLTLWEFCMVFGAKMGMSGEQLVEANAVVLSTQRRAR